jgi:hypothetical protein
LARRLLFQQVKQMLRGTAKEHHPRAATLWRLTAETWLRCRVLMLVRQERSQKVLPTFSENWFQNEFGRK